MKQIFCSLKNKAASIITRKKRSLDKMKSMGMENYIRVKIERYADCPALVAQFKRELYNLKAQ